MSFLFSGFLFFILFSYDYKLYSCTGSQCSTEQFRDDSIVTDGFIPYAKYHLPESPNLSDAPPPPYGGTWPAGTRLFDVYLPPNYNPLKSYPIVYHFGGLGSDYSTYGATDSIIMDSLISSGEITPLIIIFPDGSSNQYQGLWYVNSALQGLFEDYMIQQLIPYVDKKYNQKKDATGNGQPFRAIMGQSMGGYGSLYYGVKHPELFCAFAGDSPTSFWLIYTNLASPNGNPMYTFNKLAFPDLNCYLCNNTGATVPLLSNSNGMPHSSAYCQDNICTCGQRSFGISSIFSYAAAFSPDTTKCYPYNVHLPIKGDFTPSTGPCVPSTAPNDYGNIEGGFDPNPYLVGCAQSADSYTQYNSTCSPVPAYTGCSFSPNPSAIARWNLFDPYSLLDTADKKKLERQAIYLDAGNKEPVNNVGARYFSDKLIDMNLNHEYLLYGQGYTDNGGTHSFCTNPGDSPLEYKPLCCYRFATNLKLFSGKFAESGSYAPDIQARIMGTGTIEMHDKSSMQIQNIVAIETTALAGASTDITLAVYDCSSVYIGGAHKGGLQVGNSFGKAQLAHTPMLQTNTIDFSLMVNGQGAHFTLDKQGFLGFAVGINGNQTAVPNFWALSTLANTHNIQVTVKKGSFNHAGIASSLAPQASLLALGSRLNLPRTEPENTTYSWFFDPLQATLSGGGNIVQVLDSNYIHPTVITRAGVIEPCGIRHDNLINEGDPTDDYPLNPIPYYKNIGSQTFYRNLLQSGILISSGMNNNRAENSSVIDLYRSLSVPDYLYQKMKAAPLQQKKTSETIAFVATAAAQSPTINRDSISTAAYGLQKMVALGIKLIPGSTTILKTYPLDP